MNFILKATVKSSRTKEEKRGRTTLRLLAVDEIKAHHHVAQLHFYMVQPAFNSIAIVVPYNYTMQVLVRDPQEILKKLSSGVHTHSELCI